MRDKVNPYEGTQTAAEFMWEKDRQIAELKAKNKIVEKALELAVEELCVCVDQYCSESNFYDCEVRGKAECLKCNIDFFKFDAENKLKEKQNNEK